MSEDFPYFRYHPDPLNTGSIQPSEVACECCELSRGFVNTCNFYSFSGKERFCPWCIATGRAAKMFDGLFCDDFSLRKAGLPVSIIEEVSQRTPGYISWQSEVWLSCCGDACEFHGDALVEEIQNLNTSQLHRLQAESQLPLNTLQAMIASYVPTSSPAFYKWKCRVCRSVHYYVDFD